MMPCDYLTLDGGPGVLDLDAVHDVINGTSGKRPGWSALIIFDSKSGSFVELRSSPPDVRGGSTDEAEAVADNYLTEQFKLATDQLIAVRSRPADWVFLDRRTLSNGSNPPKIDIVSTSSNAHPSHVIPALSRDPASAFGVAKKKRGPGSGPR